MGIWETTTNDNQIKKMISLIYGKLRIISVFQGTLDKWRMEAGEAGRVRCSRTRWGSG